MQATHPRLQEQIKCRREKILLLLKLDDLCARALQEWISAIMHLESQHKTGRHRTAAKNTLQRISYGVTLIDGILSRIKRQVDAGWEVPRSYVPLAESRYKAEVEKRQPVPVTAPSASNFSTCLSFEEVVEAGYIVSVDALKVLQKDGYIVLNDSDIRNALASFEIDIQTSLETDD